ncbi:hypothetical protein F1C58_16815 (plasmid) [Glaciihabitans sp. INWT7]|uniref:hypothetical protein n=1 Tax=Glaciihabitans sp. INWT7 TaxID=2596912 RepID=UPI0016291D9D|nr:hypothetical protein [Glaciihabitans sp. INWT7]QNE48720.1 hypothetical protein F1C58_16815 [Glaciihabitans sp. INWT7]
MNDTPEAPAGDRNPSTSIAMLRSSRSKNTVRRVQSVAGFVALSSWTVAMFGTALSRTVNNVVFALIVTGAVAFVTRITSWFWFEVCNGAWDLSGNHPRRDLIVATSTLAFVCLWAVGVTTALIGLVLILWAGLINL